MTDFNAPEFTQYAAVHQEPKGPGDARPTALQIVKDNGLEGKLNDKVVLITGCSSGIGIEAARAMKATGAHVFATARDMAKGENALFDILEPGKLDLLQLDLNSLASVRQLAATFLEKSGNKLNILITNAGVMCTPLGKTEDGFETQMGTNHLAHFLLFQLLKPALLSSATPEFGSRVVVLSSASHRYNSINFDNIMLDGEYHPQRAYAQSKTANIYMANEIERRYGARGLHAVSVHPGAVLDGSSLHTHVAALTEQLKKMPGVTEHLKSRQQGAATTVWAAIGKCWEGKGGKYLEECQVGVPVKESKAIVKSGYEKWAFDEANEKRLWTLSNELVGFEDDA
ncbi:NAD(P)-binding protein [Lentithecium fluviatile CBS 122367]|uniref:NAD(P)-binding protein n=1 Tax=Lentithecium fluviatile CBS 122367 TaxID=1168545 RepID=A0A6G1IQ31_9PLEO|nr:NAD(P)-binding protein [Lentithecium fluviatile CBS 122367]